MDIEERHSTVQASSIPNSSATDDTCTATSNNGVDAKTNRSNIISIASASSPSPELTDGTRVVANGSTSRPPASDERGLDLNQNCSITAGVKPGKSSVTDNSKMAGEEKTSNGEEEPRRPMEAELLRQLDEANRQLEADEKSFPSLSVTPGHSRKGSGSSVVSSASTNSHYSTQNSIESEDPNADTKPSTTKYSRLTRTGRRSSKPKVKALNFPTKGQQTAGNQHHRKEKVSSPVGSPLGSPLASLDDVFEVDFGVNHSSETLWEIWGRIINDWDIVKKRPTFLKELVRKGIPHEFRGMAWQLILGVHDAVWKQEYAEHMKKTSPCEKLIRRDIARTFPDHEFFKEKDGFGQESLFNVMKAYSLHDREVGYCQGSGFIVGLLLMQMPEEDAFAVLVRLMQDFRLRELFKPSMAELGLCMYKLECLIQELLPTLLVHFQTQNFDTSMYASSWFLTLYVTSLPLSLARRIMDLFVSEGMEIIFRVGVAILQSCQEDLLALDMEGLLMYLQKDLRSRFELETDQDNLMHTAYIVKYSPKKMKKLEKDYTALKSKENEDQIELRRLRTENRLLRQRIENLEKVEARLLRQSEESATLADRLVQDQVTRAHEAEEVYSLRNQLSVTRSQLEETRQGLMDAQDIIGDIKKRTRIIEDAVHLDPNEERNMVKYLQEELIAVRLRETETATTIKELRLKISDLEDTILRIQRAPSNDVQQLQEELIAVKLREAEANLSLKELKMKVNEIESYWEAHMQRVRQASPKEKGTKADVRHLQEEVMSIKTKEARAVAEVKEVHQKLMEMETQNHICTNQIRRMGEDNKELKRQLEEAAEREKDLRTNIKDLTRKLDDVESSRKEETMMARINEAESIQQMAELRHKIAEIDIQKEEMLAAGRLHNKEENQELENKLHDLQDEVLQLQMHKVPKSTKSLMTDSYLGNNSDEELDAELQDSANLNRTLSEIIEGKSPNTSHLDIIQTIDDMTSCLDSLSERSDPGPATAISDGRLAPSGKDLVTDCDNSNASHSVDGDEAGEDPGEGDRDSTETNSLPSTTKPQPQPGASHPSEVTNAIGDQSDVSVPHSDDNAQDV